MRNCRQMQSMRAHSQSQPFFGTLLVKLTSASSYTKFSGFILLLSCQLQTTMFAHDNTDPSQHNFLYLTNNIIHINQIVHENITLPLHVLPNYFLSLNFLNLKQTHTHFSNYNRVSIFQLLRPLDEINFANILIKRDSEFS